MKDRGFTLIELLVVIAIIGILSSVVLASLNTARIKARDAQRVSDVRQIQLAMEFFYDNAVPKTYPTTVQGIAILVTNSLLPNLPVAPTGGTGYSYALLTATNYCVGVGLEQITAVPSNDQNCNAGIPAGGAIPANAACDTAAEWGAAANVCYSIGP